MPKRFQHVRKRGAKLPPDCKLVTRATRWGNPFRVADIARAGHGDWSHPEPESLWLAHFNHAGRLGRHSETPEGREYQAKRYRMAVEHAVALFRAMAEHFKAVDPAGFAEWIGPLVGHDLACSCPLFQPCHADVLLELANA
jgi:hypothetical protein